MKYGEEDQLVSHCAHECTADRKKVLSGFTMEATIVNVICALAGGIE